jgi:hypothetical protein
MLAMGRILGVLLVCILLLVSGHFFIRQHACLTETEMRASLGQEDIEITYTNRDTLAKDEAIRVYFLPSGANRARPFMRWFNRKTLVFEYDPGMPDEPLPAIKELAKWRNLISIPQVSSVIFESKAWGNHSIDYQIEKIEYP